LLSLLTFQQECVKAYRRYADTVAVLSAIYYILRKEPSIADYLGVEVTLRTISGNDITPDLIALCESRTNGLAFELKWSLPYSGELLTKEIKEIKKYTAPCSTWKTSTGKVEYHDVILVCHVDDVERTLETLTEIAKQTDFSPLAADGFVILSWAISATRGGERKEHLILLNAYGKNRNATVENALKRPGGLVLPEEVLTYLRSTYSFIRQKPPVQYTIIELIQHVFSQFQDPTRGPGAVYELTTDMIYEKSKILFPSWEDYDVQTIQAKRSWISEALEVMWSLKIVGKPVGKPDSWLVPIPTLRTREPIQSALCKKLARYQLKIGKKPIRRGRPRTKPLKLQAHPRTKRIDDYF